MPNQMTVLDVLSAVDSALFEKAEETVLEKAPDIEAAMRLSAFDVLDRSVTDTLRKITLSDLISEAERQKADSALMFYI